MRRLTLQPSASPFRVAPRLGGSTLVYADAMGLEVRAVPEHRASIDGQRGRRERQRPLRELLREARVELLDRSRFYERNQCRSSDRESVDLSTESGQLHREAGVQLPPVASLRAIRGVLPEVAGTPAGWRARGKRLLRNRSNKARATRATSNWGRYSLRRASDAPQGALRELSATIDGPASARGALVDCRPRGSARAW